MDTNFIPHEKTITIPWWMVINESGEWYENILTDTLAKYKDSDHD